jgi:hypothetical protein
MIRSIVLGVVSLALAGVVAWQGAALRTLTAEHELLVAERNAADVARDEANKTRDDYGLGMNMNSELVKRCHRVQQTGSDGYAF